MSKLICNSKYLINYFESLSQATNDNLKKGIIILNLLLVIFQILRLKSPFGGLGVGNILNARIQVLNFNKYIII